MPERKVFDVFLSHSGEDKAQVEELAERLEDEAGLKPYLDKWHLAPGDPFQEKLEEALAQSHACAVFIGERGLRPWHDAEMRAALDQRTKDRSFRVVPVLLPGAPDHANETLPAFLRSLSWVDFRTPDGLKDRHAFNGLVAGIRGTQPGRPRHTPNLPPWLRLIVPTGVKLKNPTGIAVENDVIFVADWGSSELLRIEHSEVTRRYTKLNKPHHVLITPDRRVLVADTHNHRIVTLDTELRYHSQRTRLAMHQLREPHSIAADHSEDLYLLNSSMHNALYASRGKLQAVAGRPDGSQGAGDGELNKPCGMCLGINSVYVADTYNHRVAVFTRELAYRATFGRKGGEPECFSWPVGIANSTRWLVMAFVGNKRLQLWTKDYVGDQFVAEYAYGRLCAEWLKSPFGVVFDPRGRLYVTDRDDGKILQIQFREMLRDLDMKSADKGRMAS